jgi:hypothetical protein
MFVRDIAPELHRLRGFSIYRNDPGRLALGDGRDLSTADWGMRYRGKAGPGRWMRRFSERHIRVTFTAEPPGTRVTLTGGAERDAREALRKLGELGHWPNTATPPS